MSRLAIVILALLASAFVTTERATGAQTATISGRVAYEDGRPVALYPVEYYAAGKPQTRNRARTDEAGNYTITGLSNGAYWVGFFHPDRVPVDRNPRAQTLPDHAAEFADIGPPRGILVTIANDQPVTGVDFVLTDTGAERQSTEFVEAGPDGLTVPGAGSGPSDGDSLRGLYALIMLMFGAASVFAARAWARRR